MNLVIALGILFLIWVAYGYFATRSIEEPTYTVVKTADEYEIRQYESFIVAEAEVDGDIRSGLNNGFMVVADYIFGNNTKQEPIAMTAPVTTTPAEEEQDDSEKIAMTTPVMSQEREGKQVIAFVMPAQYSMETLPKPNNDQVKLREVKDFKIAVMRFSGFYSTDSIKKKQEELLGYLKRDELTATQVMFAGYNPPWTPPFMRRNEVWGILAP